MGNKAEITTLDGMRKAAHAMVDDLFNRLPANPDGTPVDSVRLHHERPFERPNEGGSLLQMGELVGFEVRFARPVITPAVGSRLVLRTREGTFVLANQSRESLTSLIRFMVDVLGGLTEHEIVERMDRGTVLFTDMPIAEISHRSNLLFEPVGQPVIEMAPEPDDTAEQVRLAAEKERAEQEARERAEKAEAEAREAEERRLAEEKRAEDNTQQLTPETLAELREESRSPSATDLEGVVAEDVVDTEDRRFSEDAGLTEPMPETEEPAAEETKTKSKRKKS